MRMQWTSYVLIAAVLAAPALAAEPMTNKADKAMAGEPMPNKAMPNKPMAAAPMAPEHSMIAPTDIVWVDAPPGLPPGSKVAVLKGDPGKEEFYVMRAWIPAGFRIPPHWHATYENVTVISGEAIFGMGATFDTTKGHKLPAGGFASLPPVTPHYFWTEQETVLQLHGIGPFMIQYVNPADDPRTMSKK